MGSRGALSGGGRHRARRAAGIPALLSGADFVDQLRTGTPHPHRRMTAVGACSKVENWLSKQRRGRNIAEALKPLLSSSLDAIYVVREAYRHWCRLKLHRVTDRLISLPVALWDCSGCALLVAQRQQTSRPLACAVGLFWSLCNKSDAHARLLEAPVGPSNMDASGLIEAVKKKWHRDHRMTYPSSSPTH